MADVVHTSSWVRNCTCWCAVVNFVFVSTVLFKSVIEFVFLIIIIFCRVLFFFPVELFTVICLAVKNFCDVCELNVVYTSLCKLIAVISELDNVTDLRVCKFCTVISCPGFFCVWTCEYVELKNWIVFYFIIYAFR